MTHDSTTGGQMAEFWGQSTDSFDAAVAAAAEAAQAALPDNTLMWLEVTEQRGRFTDDGLEYQVAVRIGYA